ncbi:uncharacterized protein Tco025E_05047 [Trypanosoma conorhini]|uniref:Uncharacterized protein n=1 Tax=Trypanosoma conorhini TaxID=83891 RepID=A0A3R7KZS5_9TRYP|nr:uncharacterized protein Tco025E_05047 [Trypanosoma conorhini]RNF16756.1 hypothetical protein Tco025E_05047 [Trypanosoma conorhini]
MPRGIAALLQQQPSFFPFATLTPTEGQEQNQEKKTATQVKCSHLVPLRLPRQPQCEPKSVHRDANVDAIPLPSLRAPPSLAGGDNETAPRQVQPPPLPADRRSWRVSPPMENIGALNFADPE